MGNVSIIYGELSEKLVTTLTTEFDNQRLDGQQLAMALAQCLQALLQLSVNYELVQAQTALAKAQEKETLDLIEAKKLNYENQGAAEAEKKALYERQAKAYDDNLRIERAKQMGNTLSMIYAGGTKVDEGKWRESYIFDRQIVEPEYDGSDLPALP
jgi:hypothetical protein